MFIYKYLVAVTIATIFHPQILGDDEVIEGHYPCYLVVQWG